MIDLTTTELFASLSPNELRDVAARMTPVSLGPGEVLMTQHESARSMYIVESGRLRASRVEDGRVVEVGDIGAGEPVGEMALISDAPRTATVTALRECVLLRLEASAFDALVARHPGISRAIANVAIRRLQSSLTAGSARVRTITIISMTRIDDAQELAQGLLATQPRARLVTSADRDLNMIGLERHHDLVVAIADPDDPAYCESVLTAADSVVNLVDRTTPGHQPELRIPDWIVPETVILRDGPTISATAPVLERLGRGRHHHVQRGVSNDRDRTVRLLLGQGVGLALSGGGMRGYAHIGVIAALQEAGVQIDAIAGTSIGSMIGGLAAQRLSPDEIHTIMREALALNGFDATVPVVGLLGGAKAALVAKKFGRDVQIEDLPIPFTAVATNLTQDRAEHLEAGDLGWAVRASASIPGLLPPVPSNGDALIDGGMADNLALTPLRARHPGITVIASDVGKSSILTAGGLGDSIQTSPRDHLRWLRERPDLPTIPRVLSRITELDTGYGQAEPADLLIRTDAADVSALGAADTVPIRARGLAAGRAALAGWNAPS